MRYNRALLLLIPAISATFLITDYNSFYASSAQALSQTTTTECSGGSCYTVSCSNDEPCQSFSSNQPPFTESPREVTTTITQPVEETPIMQSADEATVMQPIEDSNEQYIEVPVEFCNDGLDNDDDGKVDEECVAATFSSALPNDLIDGEEKQQNEEYKHSDNESNEVYEEKEHED
jgi:hypothetical protein